MPNTVQHFKAKFVCLFFYRFFFSLSHETPLVRAILLGPLRVPITQVQLYLEYEFGME